MESTDEHWVTRDEVLAACRRYESLIPGWKCPPLFGLGMRDGAGALWFPYVCHGDHPLPAVILATVCGHEGGTASYEVSDAELEQAILFLNPAEACRAFDHPNLAAWRAVKIAVARDSRRSAVAVFDSDPGSPTASRNVDALRHAGRA
jgi:hypothetical protein